MTKNKDKKGKKTHNHSTIHGVNLAFLMLDTTELTNSCFALDSSHYSHRVEEG